MSDRPLVEKVLHSVERTKLEMEVLEVVYIKVVLEILIV